MIQFASKGAFTRQVGNLMISGHYNIHENSKIMGNPNQYALIGDISVMFGGMEFSMTKGANGFRLVKFDGTTETVLPEYMLITDERAIFRISGGTELSFSTRYDGEKPELMISVALTEDTQRLELPYKPLKTSKIYDSSDGQLIVLANGFMYRFSRALTDLERRVLVLQSEGSSISYRVIPEERTFAPEDYIIPSAVDKPSYDKVVNRWRDQNFSLWTSLISSTNNEDLIVAYLGESVSRGMYNTALAAVPASFLNGNRRTHESAVFLGRWDLGLRSLTTAERNKQNELSELINRKSLEFLKEPHVFEYVAIRNNRDLLTNGLNVINAAEPSAIYPDLLPGILEAYSDWTQYHSIMEQFSAENPFSPFIEQVYSFLAQGITKIPENNQVFVFFDSIADMAFNLRLGKALMIYAENAGNNDWAAIGRSLILSVLSLTNEVGTVPTRLLMSQTGDVLADTEFPEISSVVLYRILTPGENYPHAVSISPGGVWIWTAASSISVNQSTTVLDISVSFPTEETHYLLIRGIPRPGSMQLNNIDNYRSALDFERYDSSGWYYSDQTLRIKLRHRSSAEQHIRISN
jgi:hypothetical protein